MLPDGFRDGKRSRSIEGAAVIRSDRYIAFLLSTLPKLARTRLYNPRLDSPRE